MSVSASVSETVDVGDGDGGAGGPRAAWQRRIAAGELRHDPGQERAVERLEALTAELAGWDPSSGADNGEGNGWLGRVAGNWLGWSDPPKASAPDAPRGLYLHGDVGRGKSMLMDLFFEAAPVAAKRRVHFHAFMLQVHDRLHAWRSNPERSAGRRDPIDVLAERLAGEARLLCFDEFHVTDVADAMILGRLFTALFDRGVVMVATSNDAPDNLYRDGLQRALFLPFIDLLKRRADVLALDGGIDYRLDRLRGRPVYLTPLDADTDRAFQSIWDDLTDGADPMPETLSLKGRTLEVPAAAHGVARFDFEDLCARPLGAADYLALAHAFHTIMVSGVPILPPAKRNEAKRLITLIDTLYDNAVRVVIGAAAEPDALCADGTHAGEFRRTASRLIEMQAEDYWSRPRKPIAARDDS